MTLVARLTWQAADPVALAADLERRLGPGGAAHPSAGGLVVRLGSADVDLIPWRAEVENDRPHPGGRLVYEPLYDAPGLAGPDAGDVPSAPPSLTLAGVAWATVELDRAEDELGPWLDPATGRDGREPHLGARTRARRSSDLPGAIIVICEPDTEGRLAASLARDGEGPCALYLAPTEGLAAWRRGAAARGVAVSAVRPGPLGPSVLVAGPPAGPHLVIVERRRKSSLGRRGGTIAP